MSEERVTQEHSYNVSREDWLRAVSAHGPGRRLTLRERIGRYVHRARRHLACKIDPWGY